MRWWPPRGTSRLQWGILLCRHKHRHTQYIGTASYTHTSLTHTHTHTHTSLSIPFLLGQHVSFNPGWMTGPPPPTQGSGKEGASSEDPHSFVWLRYVSLLHVRKRGGQGPKERDEEGPFPEMQGGLQEAELR